MSTFSPPSIGFHYYCIEGAQMKQTRSNQSPNHNNPLFLRKLLRFIPAIVWMGVIYALSSRTGDEIGSILPFFQKYFPFITDFNWGHFVAYFILAMTLDYGIGARADRLGMKVAIVVLCGIYG